MFPEKIILFGASGNVGRAIAAELVKNGAHPTVVIRSQKKIAGLEGLPVRMADVCQPETLRGICDGFDCVISALGKSVSPADNSKPGFYEVDYAGNAAILEEAKKSGVKKFVYLSALHAENYPHLVYFRVHHDFSQLLMASGLNYSIVKPPAVFSAYAEAIGMAEKGQLLTIGAGDKLTNPIYEGDLAKVCVQSIETDRAVVEAGSKKIYSRHQINQLIQDLVTPGKKVRHAPVWTLRLFLPLLRLYSKNLYDKFAFFSEVMQHETIAPQVGDTLLEDYIRQKYALRK